MQPATRKTFSETLRYIPAAIVPSLMGVLSLAVYTRLLPPEEYGSFALVFTTVLFVHTFAFSWINQSVIRYYERFRKTDPHHFYATLFIGYLGMILVFSLGWYAVLGWVGIQNQRLATLFHLGPPVLLLYTLGNLVLAFARVMRKSLKYSSLVTLNAVLKFLISLLIIYVMGAKADAVLLGIIAAGVIVFVPETIRLSKTWPPLPSRFRAEILSGAARYGIPLMGMAFVNIVLSASDRYLIEYLMDSTQVGIYSAGYKITESAIMVFASFMMLAFFPALVESFEKNGLQATKSLMNDLLKGFLLFMTPILFGLIAIADDFIRCILGNAYADAGAVVPWVAAGAFAMGLNQYFNKSFELKEKTSRLLLLFAVAAGANVLLNLVLIPPLGITGAAVATFAAYLLALMLSAVFGAGLIRWRFPWKTALIAAAGSTVMAAVVRMVPGLASIWGSLFLKIIIGAVVYAGFLWLVLRTSGSEEVRAWVQLDRLCEKFKQRSKPPAQHFSNKLDR